jgi:hypothetical protein
MYLTFFFIVGCVLLQIGRAAPAEHLSGGFHVHFGQSRAMRPQYRPNALLWCSLALAK